MVAPRCDSPHCWGFFLRPRWDAFRNAGDSTPFLGESRHEGCPRFGPTPAEDRRTIPGPHPRCGGGPAAHDRGTWVRGHDGAPAHRTPRGAGRALAVHLGPLLDRPFPADMRDVTRWLAGPIVVCLTSAGN